MGARTVSVGSDPERRPRGHPWRNGQSDTSTPWTRWSHGPWCWLLLRVLDLDGVRTLSHTHTRWSLSLSGLGQTFHTHKNTEIGYLFGFPKFKHLESLASSLKNRVNFGVWPSQRYLSKTLHKQSSAHKDQDNGPHAPLLSWAITLHPLSEQEGLQ